MIALIPARGGSKGLPGKNIRPLAGKPLIAYSIEAALQAKSIDRVICSTDCEEIASVAKRYGAEVPFLRPAELAQDNSLAIDNYIYTIDRLSRESGTEISDFVVLLPTAPLRTAEDIDAAVAIFRERKADSVISFYPAPHPVQWYKYVDENGVLRSVLPESNRLANRQEEKSTYLPNGAIYVFRLAILKGPGVYYTDKTYPYIMPAERSVDIDNLNDFRYAEFLTDTVSQPDGATSLQEITLDELPIWCEQVDGLMGLKPILSRQKTETEVLREFQKEKWADVLQQIKAQPAIKVEEIDRSRLGDRTVAVMEKGRYYRMNALDGIRRDFARTSEALERHSAGASALVELGAGYGSTLLNLVIRYGWGKHPLFAAEYTEVGMECIRLLAANHGLKVPVGYCDFRTGVVKGIDIPPSSLIYTHYAAHYCPQLGDRFVPFFSSLNPHMVVHFEPCFEHCNEHAISGLLAKRYIEANDYNRDLVTVLHHHHDRGEIEIVQEEKAVVGVNALLPMSIIAWRPVH